MLAVSSTCSVKPRSNVMSGSETRLLIKSCVCFPAIIMVQRHISLINDVQRDVQLLGKYCQWIAINACQNATTQVCHSRHITTLHVQACLAVKGYSQQAALSLRIHDRSCSIVQHHWQHHFNDSFQVQLNALPLATSCWPMLRCSCMRHHWHCRVNCSFSKEDTMQPILFALMEGRQQTRSIAKLLCPAAQMQLDTSFYVHQSVLCKTMTHKPFARIKEELDL